MPFSQRDKIDDEIVICNSTTIFKFHISTHLSRQPSQVSTDTMRTQDDLCFAITTLAAESLQDIICCRFLLNYHTYKSFLPSSLEMQTQVQQVH